MPTITKTERKTFTEQFMQEPRKEIIVGPICACRSFRLPHELKRHRELDSEHDWSLPNQRKWRPIWEENL